MHNVCQQKKMYLYSYHFRPLKAHKCIKHLLLIFFNIIRNNFFKLFGSSAYDMLRIYDESMCFCDIQVDVLSVISRLYDIRPLI